MLPRLDLEDIPNVSRDIPHRINGNIITAEMMTGGIVYADMAFDVSDYSYSELEDLSVLSRLLLMTNVGGQGYSDFLTELRFKTGAAAFMLEAGTDSEGSDKVYLLCRFKALKELYQEALELISRLLKEHDSSSQERIKAALTDIETDFQSSVLRYGHQYAVGASSAILNPSLYTTERIQGLLFWYRIEEMLKDELSELPARLRRVAEKTFVSNRIIFHLAYEKGDEGFVLAPTEAFISSLEPGSSAGTSVRIVEPLARNRAYLLSSPVSYLSLAQHALPREDSLSAAERMLVSIASKNSLWSLIREKGGAYGAGGNIDTSERIIYFYTYRDPRVDGSVSDMAEAVRSEEITESSLEDGKLNILSKDVRPIGPSAKALLDLSRYLYKVSDELRHRQKNSMLELTPESLEAVRDSVVKRIEDNPSIVAISELRLIEESGIEFETYSLPLK